jgi:hypothetical protein
MADTKNTALTALTGANSAPTDSLYIVDVSDNTMAASGTSKSITREELQTFPLGTITTDKKIADYSATWNNAAVTFTGFKLNVTDTSSNAASLLMDLQVGASSRFKVTKGGTLTLGDGTNTNGFQLLSANRIALTGSAAFLNNGAISATHIALDYNNGDATISRTAANALRFGPTAGATATTTTRTEINKAVASIADNTATATFTVTVPNAAHSAMLKVTLVGSLGAGGAVGANEATGTISYDFAIARTTGLDTVVGASSAYGSSTAVVAGAATITITAAASAMTGAASAQQTFTINVTIAKGSGASANHTCLCYGRLLNANATGVTIA